MNGENPHVGHRKRLEEMIGSCDLSTIPEHMILEYLLFFTRVRVNTNPTAHRLIDRFGSLSGVFDAEPAELMEVEGIGIKSATFLSLVPRLCALYAETKRRGGASPLSDEEAAEFFVNYYLSKTREEVTALLLDNGGRVISFEVLHEGTLNSVSVNPRRIAEAVFGKKASAIILAHNHPSGRAEPSETDLDTTRRLMDALIPLDIELRAHLLVAGEDCVDLTKNLYDRERFEVAYIALRANDVRSPSGPHESTEISEEK